MAALAWIDVAQAAYLAGFRGDPHATAVALTQPESSRDPKATNLSDPNGGSFGLLQINGVHDPAATGTYPDKVPTQEWIARMYDPLENMRAAFQIWLSNGKTFKPWGAFTSGLHVQHLATAKVALDARARIERLETTNAAHVAARAELEAQLAATSTLLTAALNRIQKAREALA